PGLDELAAETLGGRQGEALVGEEEERRLVPLHEPFHVVRDLFRGPLPEILVIQCQGAEGTVLVIAAAGKLDGENGLGREVLAERKAVKVRRRQRIDVFGKERLVDDGLPVLTVDEVRHLAEIALPLQLMDELQQGSL